MTTVSPEVIETHEHGRKLTKQEIADFIALSGELGCSACGDKWREHRIRCVGSEVKKQPTGEE